MTEHVTPNGSRVFVVRPATAGVLADADPGGDVTEAVQALYDLTLSSMDFGSGFLSIEELVPLRALADACGFDTTEIDEHYPDGKFVRYIDHKQEER